MKLNNSASHIILVCILFVFQSINITGQKSQHNHKDQPCISESEYTEALAVCTQNAKYFGLDKQKKAALPTFIWPLRLAPGFDYPGYYVINNYVDLNLLPGQLLDYSCGAKTYDGHNGTDIDLDPFEWQMMDEGAVEVIAAAAGTIIQKRDGYFDLNCGCDDVDPANSLIIQHADGSRAWYWHLKKNTLTTKEVGDMINLGDYIGLVGSSGCSSHPHLHFEVRDANNNVVDPFSGTCNNTSSLWANQRPYNDAGINRIGTYSTATAHSVPNCFFTHFVFQQDHFYKAPGDNIFIELNLRHTQAGETASIIVQDPNGNPVMWVNPLLGLANNDRHSSSVNVGINIFSSYIPGKYTASVSYKGQTETHDFWIHDACVANRSINNEIHSYDRWYTASQTIVSNSDSNAGVETLYNANDRVTLTPGFSAKNGFHAYLGDACPD